MTEPLPPTGARAPCPPRLPRSASPALRAAAALLCAAPLAAAVAAPAAPGHAAAPAHHAASSHAAAHAVSHAINHARPAGKAAPRVASRTHAPGPAGGHASTPDSPAVVVAADATGQDVLAPMPYPAFVPAGPGPNAASVTATPSAMPTVVAAAAVLPAADPAPHDGVTRFLADRGLLSPVHAVTSTVSNTGSALLSHVRDGASGLVDGATGLVSSAMNFLGVPYRRGGSSVQAGFDCSGFTRHVFENSIGLVLPHRADEQAKDPGLLKVDLKDLKPGDLVFFNTLRRTFSHVGIYLGDGKFIHSPKAGETVRVEDMRISYWSQRFTGGRRAPGLDASVMPSLQTAVGLSPAGAGAAGNGPSPMALMNGGTSSMGAVAPRAAATPATYPAWNGGTAPPLGER